MQHLEETTADIYASYCRGKKCLFLKDHLLITTCTVKYFVSLELVAIVGHLKLDQHLQEFLIHPKCDSYIK